MELMISKLTPQDLTLLSNYQRHLLERIRPLLARIDPSKLGDGSLARIAQRGRDWIIEVNLISPNGIVPGLNLFAAPCQCILGFAESEIIECHRNPDQENRLVDMVYTAT